MGAAAITMNDAAEWRPAVNPWIIALTVTLATFMEVLDTSIANVALPHIAGSLSAGQDESTWVLTSYLVSNAIVLPLSGWLSSIIGRKRFYMGCVALFTISSFLCGLAPNLAMLIFFRVLQGAGGGGLQPSEQAILADTFPPAKRGMAFAVYGIAVVMAPAIGPTLGGWITDNFTWRWIFFINIPVGIISLLLTSRLIQDPPYFKRRKLSETRIDYIGLGFVALGLGTLQVILDKGQREDWFESHFIVWLTVVSAAVADLRGLLGVEPQRPHHRPAFISRAHLRHRELSDVHARICPARQHAAVAAVHADDARLHCRTVRAGADAGRFHDHGDACRSVGFLLSRYSPRWLMLFGLPMLSFSLFHMTRFDLGVDFRTVTMARVYQAVGLAFLFVPINTAAYAFLPRDKNNAASGLMNLARNIGGSVGISFVTTGLARRAQFHQVATGGEAERRQSAVSVRAARDDGHFFGRRRRARFRRWFRAAACLCDDAGECDPAGDHAGLHR